jgi:hypothetical protein
MSIIVTAVLRERSIQLAIGDTEFDAVDVLLKS